MKRISSTYEQIYKVVKRIPRRRVATYGQIAKIACGCTPRMVGYAMAALDFKTDVPWQRVVNARGEISRRKNGEGDYEQARRLKKEGVMFNSLGRIDLKKQGWKKTF